MRSPLKLLATATALLCALSLAACSGDDDPPAAPSAPPTPLSAFDAGGVTVARADFCDRIPDAAVEAAIGEPKSTDHYGNGASATVAEGVEDVSHEFNCTFSAAEGAEARVWVFVPAVTRKRARSLVTEANSGPGCRAVDGQGFGAPTTGTLCRTKGGAEASYRGLFVDSWLACSVSDPNRRADAAELLDRAGKWCVQAVTAAATE